MHSLLVCACSIQVGLGPMTSRNPNPNKGIESKMAAIGHNPLDLSTADDPVTRSVTPKRVSQRSRPRKGSVTSWSISFSPPSPLHLPSTSSYSLSFPCSSFYHLLPQSTSYGVPTVREKSAKNEKKSRSGKS